MLSEKRGQQVQTKTDIAITAKWVLARVYPDLQWKNVNCNINCMWVAHVYFFFPSHAKKQEVFSTIPFDLSRQETSASQPGRKMEHI